MPDPELTRPLHVVGPAAAGSGAPPVLQDDSPHRSPEPAISHVLAPLVPKFSGPLGPGVTVVIAHYGPPAPAQRLVTDLLHQQGLPADQLQVVVSDDCSPEPFPPTPGVSVVRREVNGGFGAAVNSGAVHARHARLLIMNSDVEIAEDFVVELLQQSAAWLPAVVSPFVVDRQGANAWTGRHFPTVRHQVVEWLTPLARWRHLRLLHEAVGHDTRVRRGLTTVVDWAVGCALLLPTRDFLDVGGFDESFFMNCEEIDLQRRLRARGLPTVVLATPRVAHEGGASSDPLRRRSWLVQARLLYAEKWGGLLALRVSLAAASLVNLLWNLVRRAAGREVRPLREARAELSLLIRRPGASSKGAPCRSARL